MVTTTVTMSPEVKESETLRPLVERAGEWVRAILDTMPEPVTAEWQKVANDPEGHAVGLRLSNEFGSVLGIFQTNELASQYAFHHRLNPVLRALTRTAIDELAKRLREAVGSAER